METVAEQSAEDADLSPFLESQLVRLVLASIGKHVRKVVLSPAFKLMLHA